MSPSPPPLWDIYTSPPKTPYQGSHKKAGPGYQYQDTQELVPAYFQTEHKEIQFKSNFLPSYSPIGAPPPTSKLNETPALQNCT